MKAAQFRHTKSVHNVIPGDFTQDGKVDLLVIGDGDTNNQLSMSLYVGQVEGGFRKLSRNCEDLVLILLFLSTGT
jgi:integrin alpha FG-GAP repeat containing protein 1